MKELIEKLNQLKGDKSDAEFAHILNLSPAEYSRLKSGRRPLSQRQAARIDAVFPELRNFLADALMQKPIDIKE